MPLWDVTVEASKQPKKQNVVVDYSIRKPTKARFPQQKNVPPLPPQNTMKKYHQNNIPLVRQYRTTAFSYPFKEESNVTLLPTSACPAQHKV